MTLIAVILAAAGLIFGSFVNALTWRLHEKKDWVKARSQCVHCGHQLSGLDLVPIFSWLGLGGKCRYCRQPISPQYPLVEAAAAATFVLSYLFWPAGLNGGQLYLFTAWLVSSIGLLALLIYDVRWMLLPSKLIYPTLLAAASGNLAYLLLAQTDRTHFLLQWFSSVLVASGIFFILHIISKGRWIGFGDVRLGLVTGTLLHSPGISFLMIFLASILGTVFVLPSMLRGRRGIGSRLPYGPFLILATALCILLGQSLLDWYLNLVSI
jgi:leader peptidase (prepilin peptidase)/N-methyltransferase